MNKFIANFLCGFVPGKKNRKILKRKIFGTKDRLNKLLSAGFTCEDSIITTPCGVRIDISNIPHEALGITKEIFLNQDYAIEFKLKSIVIDIGLNRGIASLFFAKYPNITSIYSFEPFKPTFKLAQRNLALNTELSKKITAFNFGIGKKEAELDIPYMENATGGMSTAFDVCKGRNNAKTEKVIVKDAFSVIAPIIDKHKKSCVVLKCDCEGAEFEIFDRLYETNVINGIDVVLMEYHYNDPQKLIDILTNCGFVVRTKTISVADQKGYIYAVKTPKVQLPD